MKHNSFKIICLIIMASIMVFSVSGQWSNSWETKVLESFNGDDNNPYIWKTVASRFISVVKDANGQPSQSGEKLPQLSFIEAFPQADQVNLRSNLPSRDSPLRSLGMRGAFDRKGYNWIDLYPVASDDPDGNPVEIPMPGRVNRLDCWIWGSNLQYYIEVFIRDYRGVVHVLKLGDIAYRGWRNLHIMIPTTIRQDRRVLPAYAGLKFVKFRLWTYPTERVDDFFVYFKQLRVLTDMFEELYDGSDLADPRHVQELWSN